MNTLEKSCREVAQHVVNGHCLFKSGQTTVMAPDDQPGLCQYIVASQPEIEHRVTVDVSLLVAGENSNHLAHVRIVVNTETGSCVAEVMKGQAECQSRIIPWATKAAHRAIAG